MLIAFISHGKGKKGRFLQICQARRSRAQKQAIELFGAGCSAHKSTTLIIQHLEILGKPQSD